MTMGPVFLLNAIGGLVIFLAVICTRYGLTALAAAGFGAATLAASWISATHGPFGVHETATGQPQIFAEVAEILAIVGSIAALAVMRRRHSWLDLRHTGG
jgi:ABC-type Na+ efflux pump permease subunit